MIRRIISLLILATVAGIACKKSPHETPTVDKPPKDKKWIVTTIAGNGLAYFADGPSLSAEFRAPLDVAITSDGTIYVADAINHRIRKIAEGYVSTFVGIGIQDTTSGNKSVAGYAFPSYLATDKYGNLYTLDVEDPRGAQNFTCRFRICCCRKWSYWIR